MFDSAMSTSLQAMKVEAMKLPPDEFAELAERLLGSVPNGAGLHPAWEAEIEQRLRDHDERRVLSAPLDEVLARVRAKYGA